MKAAAATRRRMGRSVPASLLLLCLAAAPARAASVTDMLGRPITLPDRPMRIVSLAPSLTEMVFALGRGDWLAAVTEFCDYPPEARSKPKIGGPASPDLERILHMRPDLVLATAEGNPRDRVAELRRLGVPVFAVKPDGYPGILLSIQAVGRALRAEERAAALRRGIRDRVAAVRRAVAGRPRPRVLYLVWTEPFIAAGPASFIHDLIGMAGGEDVVRERSVPYPRLGWEEVVALAPEVILVASHAGGSDRPAIGQGWSAWRSVPAVRSGRIIPVPGDPIHRPGPRVAEGVERLARALHPEVFARAAAR